MISTVDPEARHGRKTSARGFDGYTGHIAVDPDTEIITQTAVSAGNAGDASVAADLIEDLVDTRQAEGQPAPSGDGDTSTDPEPDSNQAAAQESESPKVYGDAAYGSGEFLNHLDRERIDSGCKTQPPCNRGNLFPKDRFEIDLEPETVTCPAGVTVPIRRKAHGEGLASFADACVDCALRPECTTAPRGRTIHVGPHERILTQARRQQQDPGWKDDYRATRPKVERKLAHLMRKPHGGRRARTRGSTKIGADFSLLAAAHNLARLAVLGIRWRQGNWTVVVA